MVTYTSSNTSTSWFEPCWCCGKHYRVTDCDSEVECFELMGRCEPCDMYNIADGIRHLWDADGRPAGLETCAPQFDPANSFRWCMVHSKREGVDPN